MVGAQKSQGSWRTRTGVTWLIASGTAVRNVDSGHFLQGHGGHGSIDLGDRRGGRSRGALKHDLVRGSSHGRQSRVLKSSIFGSSGQEVQENDLIDDLGIREEAVNMLEHISWHHITK